MTEKKYWVWLSMVLGAAKRNDEVLSAFPDPKKLYEATETEKLLSGVFTKAQLLKSEEIKLSDAERIIEICQKNGWEVVVPADLVYPAGLRKLRDKPLALYVDGDIGCLRGKVIIGMVGTRQPCYESIAIARRIGGDLVSAGAVVVSGGALGIDSAAHEGALSKEGKTVCVLGCGLGTDYLTENEPMRREIAKSGAVVSEYPPFTKATRYTFPERNRLISGMSHGVLVVEAGARSGSLITAKCAAAQGREVFAIPGSILVSAYSGVNGLIKDGARAVTGAKDILEPYAAMYPDRLDLSRIDDSLINVKTEKTAGVQRKLKSGLGEDEDIVYNFIAKEPLHPDDICAGTGLPMPRVITALMQLQIIDLVEQTGGNLYSQKQ